MINFGLNYRGAVFFEENLGNPFITYFLIFGTYPDLRGNSRLPHCRKTNNGRHSNVVLPKNWIAV